MTPQRPHAEPHVHPHQAHFHKLSSAKIARHARKEPAFNCAGRAQIGGIGRVTAGIRLPAEIQWLSSESPSSMPVPCPAPAACVSRKGRESAGGGASHLLTRLDGVRAICLIPRAFPTARKNFRSRYKLGESCIIGAMNSRRLENRCLVSVPGEGCFSPDSGKR